MTRAEMTARRRALGISINLLAYIGRIGRDRVNCPDCEALYRLDRVLSQLEAGVAQDVVRDMEKTASVQAAVGGPDARGPPGGGGEHRSPRERHRQSNNPPWPEQTGWTVEGRPFAAGTRDPGDGGGRVPTQPETVVTTKASLGN